AEASERRLPGVPRRAGSRRSRQANGASRVPAARADARQTRPRRDPPPKSRPPRTRREASRAGAVARLDRKHFRETRRRSAWLTSHKVPDGKEDKKNPGFTA